MILFMFWKYEQFLEQNVYCLIKVNVMKSLTS